MSGAGFIWNQKFNTGNERQVGKTIGFPKERLQELPCGLQMREYPEMGYVSRAASL